MQIRNQTTLYFIRHGETLSNRKNIRQGIQIDDYLDSLGIAQIQKLAKLVSHLNLDIIFTSYLHRAEETAALINQALESKIPLLHDYRLRERDFGSLTGKSETECEKIIPGFREAETMQTYDYRKFGGESVDQVRKRALTAILDISENYDHKNIGIVTHDGIIALLLFHFPETPRLYRGQDDGKMVSNADIYEWEITDSRTATLKSLIK